MSRTETLDAQIQALTTELLQKEAEKSNLALALAEDAENANLADDLHMADDAITAIRKRIELFESARHAAASRDESDKDAARLAGAIVARDKAVDLAKHRVKIGKQIDKLVSQLGGLIRDWNDTSEACSVEAIAAVRTASDSDRQLDAIYVLKNYTNPRILAVPLSAALIKAGVYEAGDRDFNPPLMFINRSATCEGESDACVDRLAERLDETLRRA